MCAAGVHRSKRSSALVGRRALLGFSTARGDSEGRRSGSRVGSCRAENRWSKWFLRCMWPLAVGREVQDLQCSGLERGSLR